MSESKYFQVTLAFSIILNTVVLALDRYPIDLEQTKILDKVNIFFTLIFVLEMIVKMVAVGIKHYLKGSFFNVFDSIILISGMVDLFVSNFISEDTS